MSARFKVTPHGVVIERMRPLVMLGNAIEWVDGRLDDIPGWHRDHTGRPFFSGWEFYRHGLWGCHLRLGRVWMWLVD